MIGKIADPVEKSTGLTVPSIAIGIKQQIESDPFLGKPTKILLLTPLRFKEALLGSNRQGTPSVWKISKRKINL